MARRLIVNADDFGYDPEIDRGILEAFARGLVRSTTAMVDTPFAADALRAAPAGLGIGLHAVLAPGFAPQSARAEVMRQLERFAELRGAPPTHLDSHRHVHARPEYLGAFVDVAGERGLPLRALDDSMRAALRRRGVATTDAFLGDAALRPCWTPERLAAALACLPDGVTELMAHPGYRPAHVSTSFGVEREIELRAVCDAGALAVTTRMGIVLESWANLLSAS
jgi:predicted glycoside hydrolase/deacetylase ChbG (UPF0249 family)